MVSMHTQRNFLHRYESLLLVVPLLLLSACASIDCSITSAVSCHYSLRGEVDALSDTLTILAMRPNSNDTIVLNRLTQANAFSLPVSYEYDSDQLLFLQKDTVGELRTDTVTLFKTNNPHFDSVDCPPRFFHTITRVQTTHHGIDSIVIAHPNIDYDEKENLLIYFHPRR